jgi:hypothetical protein
MSDPHSNDEVFDRPAIKLRLKVPQAQVWSL